MTNAERIAAENRQRLEATRRAPETQQLPRIRIMRLDNGGTNDGLLYARCDQCGPVSWATPSLVEAGRFKDLHRAFHKNVLAVEIPIIDLNR